MNLTTAQTDRAIGALLGTAVGDALGAGYEFKSRVPYTQPITMCGSGTFRPGEWTDDTAMAYAIAEVAATGIDLRTEEAQDQIIEKWFAWSETAKDIGIQTSSVFHSMNAPTATEARTAARRFHDTHQQRSAGNGSLMRTAPVALACLDDPTALVEAAMSISALTHFDPAAGEACALWCLAIRHAVLHGELVGPSVGIDYLPVESRDYWRGIIAEAESKQSWEFPNNGWVVTAFQAAWSAIVHTAVPANRPELGVFPAQQFSAGVERAVRAGDDADTVAAIAGGLLGARWGQSAIPSSWQAIVHGYPTATAADLVRLAVTIARRPDEQSWPNVERMKRPKPDADLYMSSYVENLFMGEQKALGVSDRPFDAVVSLCRIGTDESPVAHPHQLTVRVMDAVDPAENPNLDFVYFDVARHMEGWLSAGRRVFLHCVHTHNRTPSFLAAYLMYVQGFSREEALAEVSMSLPLANPNGYLLERLSAITPGRITAESKHGELEFYADDSSAPTVVLAEAHGVTLQRKGGVWVEADATLREFEKADAAVVALFDEREMSRAL